MSPLDPQLSASPKKVTLLKTGETFDNLKKSEGCYEQWFSRLFGSQIVWEIIDAPYGASLPAPKKVESLVITGSPVSVYERRSWSVNCCAWLAKVWLQKIPILGVCYGHQLMADALGGEVKASPNGREMGAIKVEQHFNDPLFSGLNTIFNVWQTHIDEVSQVPDQAKIIASNDHCPVQAMSIGDHCRTVQWHPEMNQAIMAHYVQERREVIDQGWGAGEANKLLDNLPTIVKSGPTIADNFKRHWLQIT